MRQSCGHGTLDGVPNGVEPMAACQDLDDAGARIAERDETAHEVEEAASDDYGGAATISTDAGDDSIG